MSGEFGLTEAVSIALGGMIGGGIYAVLGVVAQISMYATWFGFVAAGMVAICAGYSYAVLNRVGDQRGGSVSFVQEFVGNSTLAGMVGWSLLFGYVGSIAMYAFAFAEFALGFEGVPDGVGGVPLRPVVSVLAVALFVGLNVAGAQTTGAAENVLVAAKVGILVAFGVWGLAYLGPVSAQSVQFGVGQLTGVTPVVAAAISFVAFQGWQLLFYDQERIENPTGTIRQAVYISIPVAVGIYVLVALVTTNLAPEAIQQRPHVALADAASAMLGYFGLGSLGFLVVSVSALFSTGSAINATLFSAGHFAKKLVSGDLLPDQIADADADGVPTKAVLVLGGMTAAFTAWGSLGAITSFASLSFIVVFGATSLLAFRERDREAINPLPPLVGVVGGFAFAPVMLWNLYDREPETFWMVLVIGAFVVSAELLYFERGTLDTHVPDGVEGLR
ncbi:MULTISPECIES: APC family permease [Halolamina]|uniref:Amino acid transporter n=1 Tax=Halolamina pelagica TaxID=699431 RepID=A0A1I5S9T0_9EURY|nr:MULTISPECIES: APC family permease [Halolamina]NHX37159.1 amino acid permease [Halolamina sp. R1-12]SFP67480.1 Amino acid transporter [Halolamina pelagica]